MTVINSKKLHAEWDRVWDAGHLRKVDRLIEQYLERERNALAARLTAASYYFNHFHPKRVLQLISLEESLSEGRRPYSAVQVEALMIAARSLNALGASDLAFSLIGRIPDKQRRPFQLKIATMGMMIQKYDIAIKLLDPMVGQDPAVHFYLSEAYARLGHFEKSLEHHEAYSTEMDSTDPFLTALRESNLGHICLLQGKARKARSCFDKSLGFLMMHPPRNVAYIFDHAMIAGCFALEGDFAQAKKCILRAWAKIPGQGVHPWEYLEVLYWRGFIEMLEQKRFSASHARLIAYPKSAAETDYWIQRIEHWTAVPSEIFLSVIKPQARPPKNPVAQSGSLVRQLLHALVLSGEAGLSQYRIFDLLWPNEVGAVSSMPNRLDQLHLRLRSQNISVEFRQGHVRCLNEGLVTGWRRNSSTPDSLFLESRSTFLRSDVERHFKVGRSKAAMLCQSWLADGKVSRVGAGRNSVYRVTSQKGAGD